jgi:hypothetical protein
MVQVTDQHTGCRETKEFVIDNDRCVAAPTIGLGAHYRRRRTPVPFYPTCTDEDFIHNVFCNNTNCLRPFAIITSPLALDHIVFPITFSVSHPTITDIAIKNITFFSREELNGLDDRDKTPILFLLKPNLEPYTISYIDACNNSSEIEVFACRRCDSRPYDNASNTHYPQMGYNPFYFKIRGMCQNLNKQKLSVHDVSYHDYVNGERYTITWPDGTTRIQRKNNKQGLKTFELPDESFQNRPLTVQIERNDGCRLDFDVTFWGQKEFPAFTHVFGGQNFGIKNGLVEICGNHNKNYLRFIDGWRQISVKTMEFIPNTIHPTTIQTCNSGGKVDLFVSDGLNPQMQTITIPPNICKRALDITNPASEIIEQRDPTLTCRRGFTCVFDGRDIVPNFDLNFDLGLSYCAEITLRDGDGLCGAVSNLAYNKETQKMSFNYFISFPPHGQNPHLAEFCNLYYKFEILDDDGETWLPHGTQEYMIPASQVPLLQNDPHIHLPSQPTFEEGKTYRLQTSLKKITPFTIQPCCPPIPSPPLTIADFKCPTLSPNLSLFNGNRISVSYTIHDPIGQNDFELALVVWDAPSGGWKPVEDTYITNTSPGTRSHTFDNIVTSGNTYAVQLNGNINTNCPTILTNGIYSGNFAPPCDSLYSSLIYDEYTGDFNILYQNDSTTLITEFDPYNRSELSYMLPTFDSTDIKLIDFRKRENDEFLFLSKNESEYLFTRTDKSGSVLWEKTIGNLDIYSMNQKKDQPVSFIAYNTDSIRWEEKTIYDSGLILTTNLFNLPKDNYDKVINYNGGLIALDTLSKQLVLSAPDQLKTIDLHPLLKPKDMAVLSNGNFIVASEFKGLVELEGKYLNSRHNTNIVMSTYNNEGNLLYNKPIYEDRDEMLSGIAVHESENMAYHGTYHELIYESDIPEFNSIDTCSFFEVVEISDDCNPPLPEIELDEENCVISILNMESFSYVSILEYDSIEWVYHSSVAVEALQLPNGVYRMYGDIYDCGSSDYIEFEVSCAPDDCLVHYIDLQYDSLANKFVYFAGYDMDSVYYVTTEHIDTDLTPGSIELINVDYLVWDSVQYVRYDSTGTFYYFGTDSINRSFVIMRDVWGYTQTFWYEDLILESVSVLNKTGIYHLVFFRISDQKHYIYTFNKGIITPSSVFIPHDDRMPRYTRVNILSASEYMTVRAGTVTTYTFYSTAHPPIEKTWSDVLRVKRVKKWQYDAYLISGELRGVIEIDGVTYSSENSVHAIFIWMNKFGQIIRVKTVKYTDDVVITHITTDTEQHIAYTALYKDSVYVEPDGFEWEDCSFMDGFEEVFPSPFSEFDLDIHSKEEPQGEISLKNRIHVYPNPFNQNLQMDVLSQSNAELSIEIYDVLGLRVRTLKRMLTQGTNRLILDEFNKLNSGVYLLKVTLEGQGHIQKVIKIE